MALACRWYANSLELVASRRFAEISFILQERIGKHLLDTMKFHPSSPVGIAESSAILTAASLSCILIIELKKVVDSQAALS